MFAEQVLEKLIKILLGYLEELAEFKNVQGQLFEYGERLAYTECLEWIQEWKYAKLHGLDFEIEQKYPL